MSRRPPLLIGKNHPLWKGDEVGYSSLHKWVTRHKGSPKFCEGCGDESKERYEWANISGKYERDLEDFIRLCKSCHFKYDGRIFPPNLPRPHSWVDPKKQMNFKECLNCHKPFRVPKSLMRLKCCSRACGTELRKDKAPKVDNTGRIPWNAGKTGIYSEETRMLMGIKNKGIHRSFATEFKLKA